MHLYDRWVWIIGSMAEYTHAVSSCLVNADCKGTHRKRLNPCWCSWCIVYQIASFTVLYLKNRGSSHKHCGSVYVVVVFLCVWFNWVHTAQWQARTVMWVQVPFLICSFVESWVPSEVKRRMAQTDEWEMCINIQLPISSDRCFYALVFVWIKQSKIWSVICQFQRCQCVDCVTFRKS